MQLIVGIGIVAIAMLLPVITDQVNVWLPNLPDYFLEPVEHIPAHDPGYGETANRQATNHLEVDDLYFFGKQIHNHPFRNCQFF
jgi:hypothetical protein